MRTMEKPVHSVFARRSVCCAAAVALGLLIGVRCEAQSSGGQPPQPPEHSIHAGYSDVNSSPALSTNMPQFMQRRMRLLNAAQHDAVVADTRRLVKLVTELNQEIASSNANKLTPEQMRTVAEIEKLAHSVREKMRYSVRSTTDPVDAPPLSPFGPR